ncbi:MAG: glucose-6-phosphate isomerase [Deltaproteobacteria bacterium]
MSDTRLTLDVNGFFQHMAGASALIRADLEALLPTLGKVALAVDEKRESGEFGFYALPYDSQGIGRAAEMAAEVCRCADTLVVLGIGGSALGAKAALSALAPEVPAGSARVVVLDNIDPDTIGPLLGRLDLGRCCFNVISKSGETLETASQFLLVRERLLSELGQSGYRQRMIATTDASGGWLRGLADEDELRTLAVPAAVGGRFSVLSSVGLLPLAAAGIDIEALCEGARAMDLRTRGHDPWNNPALLHAALLYLALVEKGASVHVLMPYADRLLGLAQWYGQLWAESLGKKCRSDGSEVATGQTPIAALGATDQHSQVQLYVEGPKDKVVTFVRIEARDNELKVPAVVGQDGPLAYLSGKGLGELLNIEQRATELALGEAGCMTSVISLERLDARALGALFHFFEVQTVVMGGLLGINPLDQPGVEAGKRITAALAGKPGYEELALGVDKKLASKKSDLVLS